MRQLHTFLNPVKYVYLHWCIYVKHLYYNQFLTKQYNAFIIMRLPQYCTLHPENNEWILLHSIVPNHTWLQSVALKSTAFAGQSSVLASKLFSICHHDIDIECLYVHSKPPRKVAWGRHLEFHMQKHYVRDQMATLHLSMIATEQVAL